MNHNPHIQATPRQHIISTITEYFVICLTLAPFAMMVNWVFVPSNIVGGGLTGICTIIYYATQGWFESLFHSTGGAVPIWLSSLFLNAMLLAIAVKVLGWSFCLRTIYGVAVLSFWYWLIPIRHTSLIEDPLMACVFGGVAFGCCLGMVMIHNGSTGGTDIVALLVSHKYDISIGKVMILCDILIILSAYFLPVPDGMVSGDVTVLDYKLRRILYGVCLTVSYSVTIDWLVARNRQSVQFMIYSRHHADIATAINTTVNRGVTVLDGTGWYSKQPMKVVTVLASKHESQAILSIVQSIDSNAFVSYANVNGVFGAGFDIIKSK